MSTVISSKTKSALGYLRKHTTHPSISERAREFLIQQLGRHDRLGDGLQMTRKQVTWLLSIYNNVLSANLAKPRLHLVPETHEGVSMSSPSTDNEESTNNATPADDGADESMDITRLVDEEGNAAKVVRLRLKEGRMEVTVPKTKQDWIVSVTTGKDRYGVQRVFERKKVVAKERRSAARTFAPGELVVVLRPSVTLGPKTDVLFTGTVFRQGKRKLTKGGKQSLSKTGVAVVPDAPYKHLLRGNKGYYVCNAASVFKSLEDLDAWEKNLGRCLKDVFESGWKPGRIDPPQLAEDAGAEDFAFEEQDLFGEPVRTSPQH